MHVNRNQKKAGEVIFILDEVDFKIHSVIADNLGHYIIIKRSTQQNDITCVNIYALGTKHLNIKVNINRTKGKNG